MSVFEGRPSARHVVVDRLASPAHPFMKIACWVRALMPETSHSTKLQSFARPGNHPSVNEDIVLLLPPSTVTFIGGDAATVHVPDFLVAKAPMLALEVLLAFGSVHSAHTRNE